MICQRIHLGPVAPSKFVCECCGKLMTGAEAVTYWTIRVEVRRMIDNAQVHLIDYMKKKNPS